MEPGRSVQGSPAENWPPGLSEEIKSPARMNLLPKGKCPEGPFRILGFNKEPQEEPSFWHLFLPHCLPIYRLNLDRWRETGLPRSLLIAAPLCACACICMYIHTDVHAHRYLCLKRVRSYTHIFKKHWFPLGKKQHK